MTTATLPALTAGTWVIDTVHSTVGFSVRHLMVSKVRGTFDEFSGTITVAEDGTPRRRGRDLRGLHQHQERAARRPHQVR